MITRYSLDYENCNLEYDPDGDIVDYGGHCTVVFALQSHLEELNQKVQELENEMQEQCRIIGMSAERELSLISKIKSLEKETSELKSDVKIKYWQRNGIGCTAMKANRE